MKKLKISLTLLLLSVLSVFGQDYQTIRSNRIAFFDNEDSNIKCVRIDSVKHNGDTILFPFATIQQLDDNCFSPLVASWIGKSVTIKENGFNEFINKMGDTISIKTNANLGDKWNAFTLPDSLTIEARLLNHDTLSFLGITDSVKTIGFQTYDKNMNQIDLEINDLELKISKDHGFVKTFNFYLFPNFRVDFRSEKFEEYYLVGLSDPKVGVENLTWRDVNDFQAGDELHILDETNCWYSEGGGAITDKAIYKYLKRIDYADSIVYYYSRKQSIFSEASLEMPSFEYYNDTIKSIITSDSLFDKLPGEPIIKGNVMYSYISKNESPLSKFDISNLESFDYRGDSCWEQLYFFGCAASEKYMKGLGGPYYYCPHYCYDLGYRERKLVYYKKGSVTWGTPLTITGISNVSSANNINIYPNPSKDHINITISNSNYQNLDLFIYDIQGKLQKTMHLESNNSTVSITDLNSGIYILKITDNEKVVKIDKLMIE